MISGVRHIMPSGFLRRKHGLEVEEDEKVGSGWDVLGTLLAHQQFQPRAPTIPLRVAQSVVQCAALAIV
jgi:hypothetical protein